MKKYLFILVFIVSFKASAQHADYHCTAGRFDVNLTLTQDKSTYLQLSERYNTLATGYAKAIEKTGSKTIFSFYPQMGPIDMTVKTQDTIDLPETLIGSIRHQSPFNSFRETLECRIVR